MSPADDIARENAARARLDGYCERTLAARHGQRQREQDAIERWDEPQTCPTPERAAELRAQGWTPRTTKDAAEAQLGGVTTTQGDTPMAADTQGRPPSDQDLIRRERDARMEIEDALALGDEISRRDVRTLLAQVRRYEDALRRVANAESGHWGRIAHEAICPRCQPAQVPA